ncbi:MAG: response regulator transcription factor [Bacteroidota bacterium]|nr:response regulator transcription factor [Bacteroidota bacterium]
MAQTILVADDEESIVEVVSLFLQYNGYETLEAYDAQMAVNQAAKHPDLIILDVWFGSVDGTTLCKYFKEQTNSKNIPILMFSAARDLRNYTLQAGADAYIEKPFDVSDLLTQIKTLLAKQ